jgi:hypothetical protein
MYVSDDCIEIKGDNIYAAVGVLRIGSRRIKIELDPVGLSSF